jgi:hypothetical protein
MIDAVLLQQCADKALKPEIVELFIQLAGALDPLTITVRSGNRVVLVPKPTTPEEALALIRDNLGRNTVRVGITQYPAGLGIIEAGQLKADLIEPCQNIRMGTALFAKVYRIVTNWYGNPTAKEVSRQVFDDAIIAWQTGYFEGTAVFRVEDPGEVKLADPEPAQRDGTDVQAGLPENEAKPAVPTEAVASDANKAGIRIDLTGIGGRP